MSKRKSIRPKRTLFDNGRQGTKALRKRRLLFEPLEIRTTVSDSLLGLLGAGALLPDAPFAAEPETELVAGGAKSKSAFSSRETDALLADFLEGDSVGTLLGEATGEASAVAAPGPVATASTADSESVPAPREHGLIEPLQVALPGEDGSLAELDLAAMALLGGSGGSGGPPNYPPVANDDTYQTKHDSTRYVAQSMGVLYNDTDPNYGTVLSASLVSGPSHAQSFTFNSNGSFTYTPASGFVGADTFVYRASDGSLTDDAQVPLLTCSAVPY